MTPHPRESFSSHDLPSRRHGGFVHPLVLTTIFLLVAFPLMLSGFWHWQTYQRDLEQRHANLSNTQNAAIALFKPELLQFAASFSDPSTQSIRTLLTALERGFSGRVFFIRLQADQWHILATDEEEWLGRYDPHEPVGTQPTRRGPIFEKNHWWLEAVHPIQTADGTVIGALICDEIIDEFVYRWRRSAVIFVLASLFGLALAGILLSHIREQSQQAREAHRETSDKITLLCREKDALFGAGPL
jgi:hypothetical protein